MFLFRPSFFDVFLRTTFTYWFESFPVLLVAKKLLEFTLGLMVLRQFFKIFFSFLFMGIFRCLFPFPDVTKMRLLLRSTSLSFRFKHSDTLRPVKYIVYAAVLISGFSIAFINCITCFSGRKIRSFWWNLMGSTSSVGFLLQNSRLCANLKKERKVQHVRLRVAGDKFFSFFM